MTEVVKEVSILLFLPYEVEVNCSKTGNAKALVPGIFRVRVCKGQDSLSLCHILGLCG